MSKRKLVGKVISDKMIGTVVVSVETRSKHRKYGKVLKRNKKFMVHNGRNAKVGDIVTIEESRPLSRHKRWLVVEVIKS